MMRLLEKGQTANKFDIRSFYRVAGELILKMVEVSIPVPQSKA